MADKDDILTIMIILGYEIERDLASKMSLDNKLKFFMYVHADLLKPETVHYLGYS